MWRFLYIFLILLMLSEKKLCSGETRDEPNFQIYHVLRNIRPDIIHPEEHSSLSSLNKALKNKDDVEIKRNFEHVLVINGNRLIQENFQEEIHTSKEITEGTFIPVSVFCKKWLDAHQAELSPDLFLLLQEKWERFHSGINGLSAFYKICLPTSKNQFSEVSTEPNIMAEQKNWEIENPSSAHKKIIEEGKVNEEISSFVCTQTQIFDRRGREIYRSEMPQELWHTLLPADAQVVTYGRDIFSETDMISGAGPSSISRREKLTFPEHIFYFPKTKTLYVRMGTAVSGWPERQRSERPQGYLVSLDMNAEGRLLWIKRPESSEWSFAGNPLADENRVYIPMIRQVSPPEFYLTAINRRNGEYEWRKFLFSSSFVSQKGENAVGEFRFPTVIFLSQKMQKNEILVGDKNLYGVEISVEKVSGKILQLEIFPVKEK
ncbi:MAG: hypothetical protein Q4C96_10525 [Planctomycetia bacterium]|nr:hypothetical protein [Planctomycetia bacterium]